MTQKINFEDIETYYKKHQTIIAMLPYVIDKEIAFLDKCNPHGKPIRLNKAYDSHGLYFFSIYLHYKKKMIPYNWYISAQHYKKGALPDFSMKFEDRLEKYRIKKEAKQDLHTKIKYVDLIIDIDASNHEKISISSAVDSAILVRDYLLELDFTFTIVFSGKGFHFYIDDKQENENYDGWKQPNIYQRHRDFAILLNQKFSQLIDVKIYDSSRLIKLPFSLSIYPDGNIFVCTPLNKFNELETFDIENYRFNIYNVKYEKAFIYNNIKKD